VALASGATTLHFGCHGILDPVLPLESGLALSPEPSSGSGGDNGFLQAWEILEHVRTDADLVVLSACDSGLGAEVRGEGLIGLSRAFHYAGARSVLASLWSVSDASTAQLMGRFYSHLRAGATTDVALQSAQLELLAGPVSELIDGHGQEVDYSQPFHWAAFQLIGDWR
jgi:CHAT domain-containing protein